VPIKTKYRAMLRNKQMLYRYGTSQKDAQNKLVRAGLSLCGSMDFTDIAVFNESKKQWERIIWAK
jgi:hypothetical protein